VLNKSTAHHLTEVTHKDHGYFTDTKNMSIIFSFHVNYVKYNEKF